MVKIQFKSIFNTIKKKNSEDPYLTSLSQQETIKLLKNFGIDAGYQDLKNLYATRTTYKNKFDSCPHKINLSLPGIAIAGNDEVHHGIIQWFHKNTLTRESDLSSKNSCNKFSRT